MLASPRRRSKGWENDPVRPLLVQNELLLREADPRVPLRRTARKQEGANPSSLLCLLLATLDRDPVGKAERGLQSPSPAALSTVQNGRLGAEREQLNYWHSG